MIRRTLRQFAIRHPTMAARWKPVLVPKLVRMASWLAAAKAAVGIRPPVDAAVVDPEHLRNEAWLNRLHEAAVENIGLGIGRNAQGSHVLMLVMSDLRIDPRVEREARALAQGGYRVSVLCPSSLPDREAPPTIDWGPGVAIRFIEQSAWSSVVQRPGFHAHRLFAAALEIAEADSLFAVHAHDLNTSYAGFALARLCGCHLVVDFHEWTSENVHWDAAKQDNSVYEPSWKYQLQALEARVVTMASAAITVCDSIADAIERELTPGRRLHVIRNIPALSAAPTRSYPPLKRQLGLRDDQFVLLWQGGTGPTRLIEPIIEALAFAPRCTFVIRGPSLELFGAAYRAIAAKAGAADRLILCDPVPSRDVVAAARGADAGIWTLPRLCRNFTYALPNKIFEYTASNLAVLVADYPEARRMVEAHAIGISFNPYDPRSIAAAINRLIDDPAWASQLRENTVAALASLDAEGEWRKLVALYDALPRTGKAERR